MLTIVDGWLLSQLYYFAIQNELMHFALCCYFSVSVRECECSDFDVNILFYCKYSLMKGRAECVHVSVYLYILSRQKPYLWPTVNHVNHKTLCCATTNFNDRLQQQWDREKKIVLQDDEMVREDVGFGNIYWIFYMFCEYE